MANYYRKREKYCVTCNLWGGMRDIDSVGDEVIVDSDNTEGKCFHLAGPWKSRSMRATDNCNKWEVWGAFR